MTDEEIIELGGQAGIIPWTKHEYIGWNKFSASDEGLDGDSASLIQFAKLIAEKEGSEFAVHAVDLARQAVAKEREACAVIAEEWFCGCGRGGCPEGDMRAADIGDSIRARNQQ